MDDFDNFLLVLTTSISGTLLAIGGIITFIYAIRKRSQLILLFSAMWLLYGVFWFMDAAAHYLYSITIMALAIIPQLIAVPCIVIFIELVRKEHVNPIKISILAIIEAIVFYITFFMAPNDNWDVIAGYGVHNKGILRISQIVFIFYFVSLYYIWSYQTWRKAPASLKRLTNLLFIGSTLFSVVTATMYALGTFIRTFNSMAFIVHSVGATTNIIVILKDPRIINILPFKAYRILVVDTNDSVALFKHDWAKVGKDEEDMFSMMLQAIGNVLDDILKKGEVQEIQMDRAVLLIHHDKNHSIASVLIASKSSKSLRYGLKRFNEEFVESFQSTLDNKQDIGRFKGTSKIVEKIFDFVPSYKEYY
ncbi:MAG: hypothetical protein HWN79_07300 [Candidatus Lokiarchaeota archaeon]|nr:hypothetical protein [Candidatus Lokiarchaeota archaeon]